jgi:hypothetical protein
MLVRIISRRYHFTATGDAGDVAVYDERGRRLVRGLASTVAAMAWCDVFAARLPERQPIQREVFQPQGRSTRTGY